MIWNRKTRCLVVMLAILVLLASFLAYDNPAGKRYRIHVGDAGFWCDSYSYSSDKTEITLSGCVDHASLITVTIGEDDTVIIREYDYGEE